MKILFMLALSALTFSQFSLAKATEPKKGSAGGTFKVDTAASNLGWTGTKITGTSHHGTLALKDGNVMVENNVIKSADFVVDMDSLKDQDLTDEGMNKKLVGHLKSDDFFHVEKFPTATFKTTKIEKAGKDKYNVTGDLTMKDSTNSLTFPIDVKHKGDKIEATAKITIDRTKWNIRYGSGKFFANLGDKVIKDEFTVDVNLIAKK